VISGLRQQEASAAADDDTLRKLRASARVRFNGLQNGITATELQRLVRVQQARPHIVELRDAFTWLGDMFGSSQVPALLASAPLEAGYVHGLITMRRDQWFSDYAVDLALAEIRAFRTCTVDKYSPNLQHRPRSRCCPRRQSPASVALLLHPAIDGRRPLSRSGCTTHTALTLRAAL
jgi:hypothetical protein